MNSDAAYQTALKEAQAWLKSHPGKEPAFLLQNGSHYASPVWYIQWGTKTSGYLVLVNAMTGTVVTWIRRIPSSPWSRKRHVDGLGTHVVEFQQFLTIG